MVGAHALSGHHFNIAMKQIGDRVAKPIVPAMSFLAFLATLLKSRPRVASFVCQCYDLWQR
jgi:hypothetical protein